MQEELCTPQSLPAITSVEVVHLRGIWPERGGVTYMQAAAAAGAPMVVVQGDEAQRIAELWRSLPPGNQARCHIPPYALRFHSGDVVVCEASICWECNNIHGAAEGSDLFYEFDAKAPASQALLAACGHSAPAE